MLARGGNLTFKITPNASVSPGSETGADSQKSLNQKKGQISREKDLDHYIHICIYSAISQYFLPKDRPKGH